MIGVVGTEVMAIASMMTAVMPIGRRGRALAQPVSWP
jgi:hypothetical protein